MNRINSKIFLFAVLAIITLQFVFLTKAYCCNGYSCRPKTEVKQKKGRPESELQNGNDSGNGSTVFNHATKFELFSHNPRPLVFLKAIYIQNKDLKANCILSNNIIIDNCCLFSYQYCKLILFPFHGFW